MFHQRILISPTFQREDYLDLNLEVHSSEAEWAKAADIFIDRIKGRHLNAIELLLEKTHGYPTTNVEYSFSIMGLMCFLIETLYQFYYGLDETERYGHRDAFVNFLTSSQYFRDEFGTSKAIKFYSDIRNGILHQAQTKKNSQLTIFSGQMVEKLPNGIRVDVIIFYEALRQEFYSYVSRLLDPVELGLRENFIVKMSYIVNN